LVWSAWLWHGAAGTLVRVTWRPCVSPPKPKAGDLPPLSLGTRSGGEARMRWPGSCQVGMRCDSLKLG
ncbi:hypothetical protein CLOM_g19737, partial [Closterium sp. NIES-68]